MKKYYYLLPIMVSSLLAGCTSSGVTPKDPSEKLDVHEVKVYRYNISTCPFLNEDPRELTFEGKWEDYKSTNQFDFVYLNDEDELPYLTLDTYASLIAEDFKDGLSNEVKEEGNASSITFRNGDKELLSIKFDAHTKKVVRSPGGIEGFMKATNPLRSSVMDYIESKEELIVGENLDYVYSWANTNFKTFSYKGHNYFPLSLLDLQISRETSRSFWYLGELKNVYEVSDTKQYTQVGLTVKNEQGVDVYRTAESYANEMYRNKFGVMPAGSESGPQIKQVKLPKYLASYSKDAFYYVMDNFYGLGETLGYKSMAAFLNSTKYADDMLSPDGATRARAYSYAAGILNDGHTGFTGSGSVDEGTAMGISYYQTLSNDRASLQRILKQRREDQVKSEGKEATDVRYSSDGKIAYFSFDEFAAVNYDPSEGKPSDLDQTDTYCYFLSKLKEIDKVTTVEKVVIDDTINGGGYLGQLSKLLALMSKDNSSTIYYRSGENNAIGRMTSKVDVNLDGKVDETDVTFGNRFKFYILTSSYSFSCGNAFPSYAKDLGLAKVVGTKSGGGECIVNGSQLPYNSYITYSSNYHLGYYNTADKTFTGYEEGAFPDYQFVGNIYDVNAVAPSLK